MLKLPLGSVIYRVSFHFSVQNQPSLQNNSLQVLLYSSTLVVLTECLLCICLDPVGDVFPKYV